jgi:hypothetical protein
MDDACLEFAPTCRSKVRLEFKLSNWVPILRRGTIDCRLDRRLRLTSSTSHAGQSPVEESDRAAHIDRNDTCIYNVFTPSQVIDLHNYIQACSKTGNNIQACVRIT